MLKPKFITFTGIDEQTDPDRVEDLSARYPVEWGILFSRANQGNVARYPSLVDIGRFLDRVGSTGNVRFCAHICGAYSNEIMSLRYPGDRLPASLSGLIDAVNGRFSRTQINIRDGETMVDDKDVRPILAADWAKVIGAYEGAIVQCRRDFPNDPTVAWLYDLSGGAGIQPESWAANAAGSTAFCGYAGGIGPKNVTDILAKIEKVHPPEKPFWIDMEGHVRTNEWLDLDKCEAVLRAVYG